MKINEVFTVPYYYDEFACRCGDCRHTCCVGLDINISRDEYFRMMGMETSPELRDKLDLALKILPDPDPYRYACIAHDYHGDCRLLMPDGYCMLQRERGEDALSLVCRYFPRSPRFIVGPRAAMSLGCEETIYLLCDDRNYEYTSRELTFDLDVREDTDENIDTDYFSRIQGEIFECLGRRDISLSEKISIISQRFNAPSFTPEILEKFVELMSDVYEDLTDICLATLDNMEKGHGLEDVLGVMPDFDFYLSKMMINEVFYRQLPYLEGEVRASETAYIISAETTLLLQLINKCYESSMGEDGLIDMLARFFRFTNQTRFDHNIIAMRK
ncbi:flagellin lysine-N-methylase [Butyrivibrio sp. MC2013]|uniref:flagellin lysine-N-methylase n=1 Tax=Butyrivibrio sp. MC2013 TaxID=1280686 RepID=UPI00041DE036|nr:flagellin lysine-N-methylase [Butyrivibrio sp. MC2013]